MAVRAQRVAMPATVSLAQHLSAPRAQQQQQQPGDEDDPLCLLPEELLVPGAAAACTYESRDAFMHYLCGGSMRVIRSVAADIEVGLPPESLRLFEGMRRTPRAASVIEVGMDAMGPPAREVLDRLRAIVAGPDNSYRLLEGFLPLAPAPRFLGARMTVCTKIPYYRDVTLLDDGALNMARVVFFFASPGTPQPRVRVPSLLAMRLSPQHPRLQVDMPQQHGDALVLSGELLQRTLYGQLYLGAFGAEFQLDYAGQYAQ